VKALTLKNLRLVLFTEAGELVADPVPVVATIKDKKGWIPVTVSLSRFKGAQGAKTVRAVGIFADQSDKFYLGQLRLIVDHSPPRVSVKANPGVARTKELVDFTTDLSGGAIEPKTSWNFGDTGGNEAQAFGSHVKYIYRKPGDYLATATVTDKAGVRKPVTATTGVHVEEAEKKDESGSEEK
jgi:PKD repeat protein